MPQTRIEWGRLLTGEYCCIAYVHDDYGVLQASARDLFVVPPSADVGPLMATDLAAEAEMIAQL